MGLLFGCGALSSSNQRQWTRRGIVLILNFHLAVSLTPPPNNISLIALQCASRLVLVTDPEALVVVSKRLQKHVLAIVTVLLIGVSFGMQQSFSPLNWALLACAPILMFLKGVLVAKQKRPTLSTKVKTVTRDRPIWTRFATTVAIFYSSGTIMLGLMEEASCNMFANLKIHGGSSNHLLLPTGLMFHWFRESGDAHPYGGGKKFASKGPIPTGCN